MTIILVPYHQDQPLPVGDIPVPAAVTVRAESSDPDPWLRIAAVQGAVAEAVGSAGARPVIFSGDCLVAGGVVAGVQRTGLDPGIVWFDGHADLHTFQTTTSGYPGGLSLRLVTGAHPEAYAGLFGLRPVPPERAVLVDARDTDPAEADYLATGAIRRVSVAQVDAGTAPPGPFVLHIDADVIDPGELPGLRFPAPGGPSGDDVLAAAGRLLATGWVVAVHVACPWWPADNLETADLRARFLSRLTAAIG
ncbi:arginase family protein [Actinoplanes aureus]|uniref:Arginase family protein n=1 Tax=Actinoplanes aureus TaxID=2792083 RepID=A0A931C952_9ACTN|nr:arginase family protein [Actinoplanes aureus]MBG0562346.1 arginase family protein [Actinoplanes aureus]